MAAAKFWRRLRRRSAWVPFDLEGAASDFWDLHAERGAGLSVWRVATEADARAVVAITAEGRQMNPGARQDFLAIPADRLARFGLVPERTRCITSCHRRADDLHHDVFGIDRATARMLAAEIGVDAEASLVGFGPSEVRRLTLDELDAFDDLDRRDRLRLRLQGG